MGLFSNVGSFFSNIGKAVGAVANSTISRAVASVIPGGEFIRNAISKVGAVSGTIRGLGDSDSIRVTTAGYSSVLDAARAAAGGALAALAVDAKDVRAQREEALSSQRSSLQSRFGEELVYSDDLLFSAVNAVALGRVPSFSWVKPWDVSQPSVGDAGATDKVLSNLSGELIDFGSLTSAQIGDIGSISTTLQEYIKSFVLSKSLMAVNPVITIIAKLREYTSAIDNPFDFFNFLGYNGPEVVRSIAVMDRPVINGMLKRISEHETSKAFAQWLAAVDYHKATLESFRKITADWLGEQADGYPAFLIDMVTFYIYSLWGKELIINVYTRLATREMVKVIPVSELSTMNIYDLYDQIHYAQVSAKATYDRVNILTSSSPTDAEKVTYYIAAHDLIILSFLLQLSKAVMGLSTFGIDSGDIDSIYSLCTGSDTLLIDLAAICHQDNATFIRMSQREFEEAIINAELMAISLEVSSDDEIITTVSLEKLMAELASTIASLSTLSVPEKAKMVAFYKNMSIEIRNAVAEDRVSDRAYTLVQLVKIDSAIGDIEASIRS